MVIFYRESFYTWFLL